MTRLSTLSLLLFLLGCAYFLRAETFQGTVRDPSGAAIPGAQIAAVNRLGVIAQTSSDSAGAFRLTVANPADAKLMVTAAGFETKAVPIGQASVVHLAIAPQTDSIQVVGSVMDVPLSEQGGSVSVIPRDEIRQRNEAQAADLLRYLPGVSVNQAGARGGVTSLFLRGGDANFNLVEIDGIAVNAFGGSFDLAHIPADFLDRIEVIRGAQSAVYGSYANGGVVNFVTRAAEENPVFDLLAEGGSHRARRFALGGAGKVSGFGVAAFVSRLDTDGPVANSDYRNENLFLRVTRTMGRQSVSASGDFNSNETGVPGPYGSNPAGLYSGLDLISRNKNNFSDYGARYQIDLSSRVREEVFGSFFLNNGYFLSPFGGSYNKDLRGQAETRTVVSVTSHYTFAAGSAFSREEVKNTFITDTSVRSFPLRRDQAGVYWENRFEFGGRLFFNAGARAEFIHTPLVPADAVNGRPEFAADTVVRVNPKVSVAYLLRPLTRLHGSFATGIRPPAGFDLAFTDNPRLRPERTASFDIGLEQRLFQNRVSVDGTYFYNRYSDLIVSLGGELARLSSFQSDNLANSQAQGAEIAARLRPTRWLSAGGSYTFLASEILSLDGSSHLAPRFFQVGQPLIRRPRHSGALLAAFGRKKVSADVTGYFRGTVLDVEPNFGAFAGLYQNPGYANIGINLNYAIARGMTLYGNLRNALNRHYEEALGYPSPRLNFVSGLRWSFPR